MLGGSLWLIWPFQERTYELVRNKERLIQSQPVLPAELSATVAGAIVLAVLGALIVLVIHRIALAQRGT